MPDQKLVINPTAKVHDPKLSISSTTLFALLNAFPGPDDVGPWGPIGPVIRQFERGSWASLNPQPLPPNGRHKGPTPEPWHTARLTQEVIHAVINVYQVAAALGEHEL